MVCLAGERWAAGECWIGHVGLPLAPRAGEPERGCEPGERERGDEGRSFKRGRDGLPAVPKLSERCGELRAFGGLPRRGLVIRAFGGVPRRGLAHW